MTNSFFPRQLRLFGSGSLTTFHGSRSAPFSVRHTEQHQCVRLCRIMACWRGRVIHLLCGTENEDRDQDRGRKCSEPVSCPFSGFGFWSPWCFQSAQSATTNHTKN